MAKNNIDLGKTETNSFVKGLNKDSDSSFIQDGMWTHARNVVNNTIEGNLGTLSGEPANYLCATAGNTILTGRKVIVGAIHLYSDKWIIYTAVHTSGQSTSIMSEIGLFEEDICKYRIIVQDACLNFNEFNLVYGAAREKEDCSWAVYWNDGLNPDRTLNVGDPQNWPSNNYTWVGNNSYSNGVDIIQWPGVNWIQKCKDSTGTWETSPGVWPAGHPVDCITCENTTSLDCDKLRLARLMKTPCISVEPGNAGGELKNGSYYATIAYSIEGEKVTDWFSGSNVQPIWFETDLQGALEITIDADQDAFKEFILVVVQTVNQGTVAKRIGVYSTNTTKIYLDQIKDDLVTVPIEQLPIQTPIYEKSDQIVEVNNYLLRVGPTSKFDFNYQPLANLINAKWVSVAYPTDYYTRGGYKPSYLRDEVYAFFIRWIYDTGDKSVSYHIPGRPPSGNETLNAMTNGYGNNVLFNDTGEEEKVFEVTNTASITSIVPPGTEVLEDGGVVVARGKMGFWQSSEVYPDNNSDVWNSSSQCWTGVYNQPNPAYDLCGQPIRHHKFPDNVTQNQLVTNHYFTDPVTGVTTIRILGVEFENIICPKDNDGNDIPGIAGYEILRGSREGNKTIVAKGMINNLRPYNVLGSNNITTKKGLYPNHPFNTIATINPTANPGPLNTGTQVNDPYIKVVDNDDNTVDINLSDIPRNMITFHSPDTNFRTPYLSTVELKLYGNLRGISEQYFIEPAGHPKNKLISDLALVPLIVAGLTEAVLSLLGKRTVTTPGPDYNRVYLTKTTGGNPSNTLTAGTLIPTPYTVGGTSGTSGNINTEIKFNEYEVTKNNPTAPTDLNSFNTQYNTWNNAVNAYNAALGSLVESFSGGGTQFADIYQSFDKNGGLLKGGIYQGGVTTTEWKSGNFLGIVGSLGAASYFFSEGADIALRIIKTLLPERQYALQMIAYGYYSDFAPNLTTELYRFKLEDKLYLNNNIQDIKPFNNIEYRIHNLKRQRSVLLRTKSGPLLNSDTGPYFIPGAAPTGYYDKSLVTLGTARTLTSPYNFEDQNKSNTIQLPIASHYGAIKVRIRNQYGQLESIKQIPITACEQKLGNIVPKPIGKNCVQLNCYGTAVSTPVTHRVINKTPILFNGDVYINRYTEKNNMFFFYDWLYDQPNDFQYNYYLRQMLPRPRFWMNSEEYEVSNLYSTSLWSNFISNTPTQGIGIIPSSYYKLDNEDYDYSSDSGGYPGIFGVKESYFYIANSAIRDFYVESDVIVDFREAGPEPYQKVYKPFSYTDLTTLLNINPDWITRGNYYAYDYSLSIGKLYTQYFSQGNLQSRYYDPFVASQCYTYRPDRIIYSLPQGFESAKDSWYIYLANNYKEFKDQISGVKNFARTGIFITFKNSSPQLFQGVDQLQTEAGVKVTIGDGGLFTQTPQSVSVADAPFEYGSCQNKLSVIATPAGMFYISQNQGKIFKFGSTLEEISQLGLKWWFVLYLPYKLTEDFPEYPYQDNPVAGIGCQSMYSNRDGIAYFCKKDYKLKENYIGRTVYDPCENIFVVDKLAKYKLGDPQIFYNASWTVSFDPKSNFFISFHDWHPDLMLPSKITFMTTKENGIWVHNNTCTHFCNYYGQPEIMEIELPITTGQTVTTLRSVEYIMEAYKRYDCVDQFHILDQNFDHAFIYNSEQVSGHLHLKLFPKNNITLAETYPIINPNSIDILFSKEENKYRFNQFWDITKDRGEFPIGSDYPPTGPVIPGTTILQGPKANERTWITEPNGYIRNLNQANLDYNKPTLERKKFRHYLNYLVLRKDIVGDVDMILKLTNAKQVFSPR